MAASTPKPTFFANPAAFRAWLEANHDKQTEVFVGLYKRASGKRNMSWSESVDEALCFGWIDSVGRSLGEDAFMIRFTPRRPGSIWSAVNVAKMAKLEKAGKLHESGRAAFALRKPERTGVYSFERATPAELSPEEEKKLRANRAAAKFFGAQPPGYRRVVLHWIVSAKKAETRERRLARVIEESAAERRLGQFVSPTGKKPAAKKIAAKPAAAKRLPAKVRTGTKKTTKRGVARG